MDLFAFSIALCMGFYGMNIGAVLKLKFKRM